MPKKVLIVYATGGMGHVKAARATEEAFAHKYPDVEVKSVDVIDYANTLYKKVFVDGYNFVSAKRPELWGWLYRNYNKKSRQKLPTYLSKLAIEGKFIPFIQEFAPDFIVSTHPLPMRLISQSKQDDIVKIQSSMVVTDFGCHSFWVDDEVNFYFVATDDVATCLNGFGVPMDKIVVTGIPIERKFGQPADRITLAKKLGLDPNLFTLLIVGGQFRYDDLVIIINGLQDQFAGKVQCIVVAGRDKELKDSLDQGTLHQQKNVVIRGFVDNMDEFMSISDVIFSKAGGLTVSECLAKQLPIIINRVIPGQEEDNVIYLTKMGAALKAESVDGIIQAVGTIIQNPDRLATMKAACGKIGKPHSAESLADFVYQFISKK